MAKPLPQPEGWEYVRVSRSKLHGRGLFATRDLPKGTCVMEYKGERVSKKEGNRRTDAQWAKGRVYTFELSTRVDLDGSVRSNLARLANFSCDPNCESENEGGYHIWIKALRDIKAGEEITYDYNFPLVEPPPVCLCGAKTCRGYIVGSDHVKELKAWLAKQKEHKPERKAARVTKSHGAAAKRGKTGKRPAKRT
ncbi:MAG: SET domain-containing protein [Thermoplasmatota archaeon]